MPSAGKPVAMETDPNFARLYSRDREAHLWAMRQTRDRMALERSPETARACAAETDAILNQHDRPLGEKPVIDVSTGSHRSPEYTRLQSLLLSLSQNSKEVIAENSSHFVMLDRPDLVIDAIRQVVLSARNKTRL
jgi:pimeloyl-ACP methyl ester carboxylesterase